MEEIKKHGEMIIKSKRLEDLIKYNPEDLLYKLIISCENEIEILEYKIKNNEDENTDELRLKQLYIELKKYEKIAVEISEARKYKKLNMKFGGEVFIDIFSISEKDK
jgi:hypothetical protein